MSLSVRRLAIAAPLAELIPVAVLTALLPILLASGGGTLVYQIIEAQRLALWVGPISGFVACALGGWWVARGTFADTERNGLTLGVAVAAFDVALLAVSGAPVGALMVLSAIGRIAGGYVGGWWAGRKKSANDMLVRLPPSRFALRRPRKPDTTS
jgi:hypothetical protein